MDKTIVQFNCSGTATGKMRNELSVTMAQPFAGGPWELATDEGSSHGGDTTAPPPLALFVAGLTASLMTQLRAFAKRTGVELTRLDTEVRMKWNWAAKDKGDETAPEAFEIDVLIESPASTAVIAALIEASKRGCFIEQTLGQRNTIRHRLKTEDGWIDV